MTDVSTRLLLEDYALDVEIGIHDFERAAPQRVLVSVEIEIGPAPETDCIDEALDYDFLRREIGVLAASRRFNLQETFCRGIIGLLLARSEVRSGRVTTRKPDVYSDCAAVGVEMRFARGTQGRTEASSDPAG